jgi:2-methylcitrate dehydratase PrpD
MKQENITKVLADYVVRTRFEDLPDEAIDSTKNHILHTLGTIVAGSRAPGIPQVLNCINEWSAKGQSTVLVYGNKFAAPSAALINASMGHSFHIDMKDDRRSYPTAVATVPAALAMTETLGATSGKELITAACIGMELGVRMGLAVKPFQQIHTESVGPVAAAVCCGKLLKLDENGIYNALAVAYRRATVAGVTLGNAALNEMASGGYASEIGVQSALLAAQGFALSADVFQGPRSLFQNLYKEDGDLDILLANLGKRYEIAFAGPKPYPCHRGNHPGLTGVLALRQTKNIDPEQIEEVRIYVEKRRIDTFEKNKSKRYRPPNLAEVQHAYPYLVAVALLKGKLSLKDTVTEEAIRDEKVLKYAERVKLLHDASLELDNWHMVVKPHVVEIAMRDGTVFSERVEYPKGDPKNPLTRDEYLSYFADLIDFSAKPLNAQSIEKTVSLVSKMEEVPDVSSVCSFLT